MTATQRIHTTGWRPPDIYSWSAHGTRTYRPGDTDRLGRYCLQREANPLNTVRWSFVMMVPVRATGFMSVLPMKIPRLPLTRLQAWRCLDSYRYFCRRNKREHCVIRQHKKFSASRKPELWSGVSSPCTREVSTDMGPTPPGFVPHAYQPPPPPPPSLPTPNPS